MQYDVLEPAGAAAGTVLLSSGLGGAAGYWQPQLAALNAGYRVITYDQRGTGRSAASLPDDYGIAAMADDVVAILDALGGARVHFVGHALGGLIGLDLALRRPDRLATLTAINAWARLDPHTARCFAVRKDLLLNVGVAAYVRAQPIFLHPAAWLSTHAARIEKEEAHGIAHFQGTDNLLRRIGALSRFDVADRLGEIATPTLVAANRDDVLVPYTCSVQLAAAIPGAVLELAESGGHAGNVTDPAPFNENLLRFLDAHAA